MSHAGRSSSSLSMPMSKSGMRIPIQKKVHSKRVLTRTPWEARSTALEMAVELGREQGPRRRAPRRRQPPPPPRPSTVTAAAGKTSISKSKSKSKLSSPVHSPTANATISLAPTITKLTPSPSKATPVAAAAAVRRPVTAPVEWSSDSESSGNEENSSAREIRLCSSARTRARRWHEDAETKARVADYHASAAAERTVPVTDIWRHMESHDLCLDSRGLGERGGRALATAVASSTSLKRLSLRDTGAGGDGVAALAQAVKGAESLEELDVSRNNVDSKGARALSAAVGGNTGLKILRAGSNAFLDLDSSVLARALRDSYQLEVLDLHDNRLGDAAGMQLGAALADNDVLRQLDLSNNCIRARGGAALARGLAGNAALKKLVLSGNGVGDTAASGLASVLGGGSNEAMRHLELRATRVTETGARALASALRSNTTLRYLDVSYNPITCDGVRALLKVLMPANSGGGGNESLDTLILDGIPLDKDTLALLDRLLRARPGLHVSCTRPGYMVDRNALNAQLAKVKHRMQTSRRSRASMSRSRMRRRSSTLSIELGPDGKPIRRWPTGRYDPTMSDEEKWRLGYNPDGTPRTDAQWLQQVNGFDKTWDKDRAWGEGYNPDGTLRSDGDWNNIQRMRSMSMASVFYSDSESESSEYDSEDEMAVIRHHRRHLRLCTHRFSKMYPDTDDPMAVLERYVDANKLRFVDLFFQMDRDRSGTLSVEEVQESITLLGLELSELQTQELMTRMDMDGDGLIDYRELAEGRRAFIEKMRAKDPNWTTKFLGDGATGNNGSGGRSLSSVAEAPATPRLQRTESQSGLQT